MEEILSNGKIYIIGDLHLSLNEKTNKSMEVFGGAWKNYISKIKKNWEKINDEDIVIIAGDISWGMTLEESLEDFKFLNSLSGTKILLKGNHDYWWESKKKMQEFFEKYNLNTLKILYNNSYNINGINIYGTKGWSYDEEGDFKNLRREGLRLKISRDSINKDGINICIIHYPPFLSNKYLNEIRENENFKSEDEDLINYINIMKENDTKVCFYAHLHGTSHLNAFEGFKEGIYFKLVSGDFLDFNPLLVDDLINDFK